MKGTYHLFCVSEAIAPITYGFKTAGNQSLVAREDVVLPEGRRALPILWANGLKHQLLREHAAAYIVERLGMDAMVDERMLAFLFNGGVYHLGGGYDKTSTRVDVARLFPMVSLARRVLARSGAPRGRDRIAWLFNLPGERRISAGDDARWI